MQQAIISKVSILVNHDRLFFVSAAEREALWITTRLQRNVRLAIYRVNLIGNIFFVLNKKTKTKWNSWCIIHSFFWQN